MRTPSAIAAILLVGVVGTACGARLPADVRSAASNAVLNSGGGNGSGGITSSGGSTSTGGSTGSGTTGGTQGTSGTAGSKGTSGSQGSNGSQGTNTSAGKPPAGCPKSGTDVGLTNSTINLGTVADLHGPVDGLFLGAEQGVEAYQAYINNAGGLCGHAVHFDVADSQTNCQANESATSSLVKKDFAMVGSFSLYDNCGATVLKQNPTVPDIHVALDPAAEPLSNHFDLEPGALGYASGMWKYYAQKFGTSAIQHTGTIAENLPSALAKQHAELKAAGTAGWKFPDQINEAPTTSDFQSDFQKMCGQSHIKVFFTVTEDAQNAATMISDENKVPACKGIKNIIPIAYDQAFLTFCKQLSCGSNENTVEGWNEYSLFFNAGEANSLPELKLFQTWFHRANGNQPINLYAMFAWADARLFQQAYEHAGATANRRTVLASLRKIKKYDDGGVIAPTVPGSKTTGNTCYVVWHLTNGAFGRTTPSHGFRCDGSYVKF